MSGSSGELDLDDEVRAIAPALDLPARVGLDAVRRRLFPKLDVQPAVSSIGRFVVHRKLGSGAMGVVFEAWDPQLGRKIALKVIRGSRSGREEEEEQQFLREARALARLRHPSIVAVHEVGIHDGQLFIAMDFVEGTTLTRWMIQGQPPRRVVDLFVSIARGLAAAHEAGIVHQDFKPDNVLVTPEHEPFVVDFGVARTIVRSTSDEGPLSTVSNPESTTVAGTPAYMAPEQARGEATDARADQFAFATALYEGLMSTRPFADTPPADRLEATRFAPPRQGYGCPRPLRRILERALSFDPADRYPSMEDLLEDIEKMRRSARRRRLVGAGFGAAGFGALLSFAAFSSPPEQPIDCQGFGEPLAPRWDRMTRRRIGEAFASSGAAYAADASRSVDEAMNAYVAEYDRLRIQSCRATYIEGTRSPQTLELQLGCLERRFAEVDGLLEAFEHADEKTVRLAPDAVSALTPIAVCDDVEGLARIDRISPLPENPRARERTVSLRRSLARLRSLHHAGRYEEGLKQADELLQEALELDDAPSIASARYRIGGFRLDVGEPQVAEIQLDRAFTDAIGGGDDGTAAAVAATLAHVVGVVLRRHDEGQRWAKISTALARRVGRPSELTGRTALQRGNAALLRGQYDKGRAALLEAAAAFEDAGLRGELGETLSNLAVLERRAGRLAEATERFDAAETILLRVYGPHHPRMATLWNNRAALDIRMKRWDQAEARLQRALAVMTETSGPEHPSVGHALNNLGEIHAARDEHAQALEFFDRALELWTNALTSDHPLVAHVLTERALSLVPLGRYADARNDAARALEIRRQRGATNGALGRTRYALGLALPEERRNEAREHMHRAREALAEQRDSPTLSDIDRWLAEAKKP